MNRHQKRRRFREKLKKKIPFVLGDMNQERTGSPHQSAMISFVIIGQLFYGGFHAAPYYLCSLRQITLLAFLEQFRVSIN